MILAFNRDRLCPRKSRVVLPRKGEFYALEFTLSGPEIFQIFLDHANRDIQLERTRNLLILDNASWHKSKSLDWGRFEPIFLPPCSPDLNPIERLWLINRKDENIKTCAIPTALWRIAKDIVAHELKLFRMSRTGIGIPETLCVS